MDCDVGANPPQHCLGLYPNRCPTVPSATRRAPLEEARACGSYPIDSKGGNVLGRSLLEPIPDRFADSFAWRLGIRNIRRKTPTASRMKGATLWNTDLLT
jgi:hypothetical protein